MYMETKRTGVAVFISDKIDFNLKTVVRDKEGQYVMIKGSICQNNIIINMHAPNIGAFIYIKQVLTDLKGEINNIVTATIFQYLTFNN